MTNLLRLSERRAIKYRIGDERLVIVYLCKTGVPSEIIALASHQMAIVRAVYGDDLWT